MLNFWVPGVPQPGGSKKGFVNPKTKRVIIVEDAKRNKDWRGSVQTFALQAHQGEPLSGPLRLEIRFFIQRPKSHYGSGRNSERIKPGAPTHPTVKPDVTKLIRSTEDALTGILWGDDAQVVEQTASKSYGPQPGARIIVTTVD